MLRSSFLVVEEGREIVVERAVDHRVSGRSAAGERLGLFQVAAMNFDAGRFEPPGTGVGAGEAEHLMAATK